MSSLEHIVRGFKATLVARAVYMASNAVLMLLLARFLLDPAAYGSLYWAIGILGVVQLVADVGLGKSASRYFAEYREADAGQIRHLVRAVLGFKLVLVGVVCAVLLYVHEDLAVLLGEPDAAPFLAAGALYVAARSFQAFTQVSFQGFNQLVYSAAVQAIGSLGRLVFAVAFVLAGLGALGAFYGYVVGSALAAVFGLTAFYFRCYVPFEPAAEREEGLVRRLLEYSVPLTATRGANVIDKRIDTVLVGVFLTPAAVAFYTLAKQISDFVLAPALSLGFTISPNFGEQKAADELERTREIYETALTNAMIFYVPAAAGLAIVAEPFIRLVFGADYLGAVPVLQLFAAFVVLQAIVGVTTDGLDYLGRARARATAKGATALANFGLNVALIPAIGVVGAALATVITHSVYTAVNLYVVHSELSLRVGYLARTAATIVGITGVMAGTVLLAAPLVTDLVMLAAVIGLGGVTWAVLAVASGLVDPGEVRAVI